AQEQRSVARESKMIRVLQRARVLRRWAGSRPTAQGAAGGDRKGPLRMKGALLVTWVRGEEKTRLGEPGHPVELSGSAAAEVGGGEVEEVLGVDEPVGVEVRAGVGREEVGDEVEEVLGVDEAVGVEVGAAEWGVDDDELGGLTRAAG